MLDTSNPQNEKQAVDVMTDKDFADLGIQDLVYVHEVAVETALDLFPEIEELPFGSTLFAVHAADGTPILLAEDLESASHAAEEHSFTLQQVN